MMKRRLLCLFMTMLLAVTLLPVTGTVLAADHTKQTENSVMSVSGYTLASDIVIRYYDTIEEAMAAAAIRTKKTTLTLLKDAQADSLTFSDSGKKYTLDLDKFTLTLTPAGGSAGIVLEGNSSLTVTGNAAGKLVVTGGAGIQVNTGCSLTVESGTVQGAGAAITTEGGTTTVTGGELLAIGENACIFNVTAGALNVQDSDTGSPTINTSGATAFRSSGGTLNITGGVYTHGVSIDSTPAMTLEQLLGSDYCAYTENGTKVDLSATSSIDTKLHIMQECTHPTFDSNDICTGCGLAKSDCPHLIRDASNVCTVCDKRIVAAWTPASGDTVYHASLAETFAAANGKEGTVTLLTSITVDAALKLGSGSVVTLDLGGHTLSCWVAFSVSPEINTIELEGSACLTVKGPGTLTSGTNMKSVITAQSDTTLIVESGAIYCNRFYPAISSSGTVRITGGTLTSDKSAVVSMNGGELLISGGTFPAGLSIDSYSGNAIVDGRILVDKNGVPLSLGESATGYVQVEPPKKAQAAPTLTDVPLTAEYGDIFTITLNDTGEGTGQIIWQLPAGVTVEPGDAADQFKVTVKAVGDMTIQVVKAADDVYQGIRSAEYTVAVDKRTLTPSITGTLEKTWDGTTATNNDLSIALGNIVPGDAPVVRAQSFSYSNSDAADPNIITATGIALEDGWDACYQLSDTKATAPGRILKATPGIVFAPDYDPGKTYDGQPAVKPTKEQLTLTFADFAAVQLAWSAVNDSSLTNGEPVDAGTYKLTASISATPNTEAVSESIEFEITKAAWPGDKPTLTVDIKNGSEHTDSLSIENLFGSTAVPAGAKITGINNLAAQQIMASVTHSDGNSVIYTSKINPAGTTSADVFDVQIQTRNYADFACELTFQAVEKTPVSITGTAGATGLIYTGAAQAGYTGTPVSSTYTGSYQLSYTGTTAGGSSYSSTAAPIDAGSYTVTIKVPDSDSDYAGSVFYNFSIAKAVLTWDVSDLAAAKYIGDADPAVTGTLAIKGLPAGQETYVTVDPGAMTTVGLDRQNTAGSYPVSIAAANGFGLIWIAAADQNNYDTTALADAPVINAIVSPRSYVYIDGANQTVRNGSDAGFVVDAPYDRYMDVKVNGVSLEPAHYLSESGSTQVTLKTAYLATLAPGVYTLEVVFSDGSATTTFTVPAPEADVITPAAPTTSVTAPAAPFSTPADTGDDTDIVLWYCMAAVGLLGAAAVILLGKRQLFPRK